MLRIKTKKALKDLFRDAVGSADVPLFLKFIKYFTALSLVFDVFTTL